MLLEEHAAELTGAAFSRDGTRVVTASTDGTARVWGIEGGGARRVFSHGASVTSAIFHPDDARVLTASGRWSRLWRADGDDAPEFEREHAEEVVGSRFCADGIRVFTCFERAAELWWLDAAREPAVFGGASCTAPQIGLEALCPEDARVVWMPNVYAGVVRVQSVEEQETLELRSGSTGGAVGATFSRDGKHVLACSMEFPRVWLWNADGTGHVRVLEMPSAYLPRACFSPDGRRVAVTSTSGPTRVWKLGHREPRVLADVSDAQFSADGRWVFVGRRCDPPVLTVTSVSGDDDDVALAPRDATSSLDELHGGTEQPPNVVVNVESTESSDWFQNAQFKHFELPDLLDGAHLPPVIASAVERLGRLPKSVMSDDGRHAFTLVEDDRGEVGWLWSPTGDAEARALNGHGEHAATAARFSPDASRLFVVHQSDTLLVYETGGGEPIVLDGHECHVVDAAFSPDGGALVTLTNDNVARIWTVTFAGLQRRLRDALDEPLAPALRQMYLGESAAEAHANFATACATARRRADDEEPRAPTRERHTATTPSTA